MLSARCRTPGASTTTTARISTPAATTIRPRLTTASSVPIPATNPIHAPRTYVSAKPAPVRSQAMIRHCSSLAAAEAESRGAVASKTRLSTPASVM